MTDEPPVPGDPDDLAFGPGGYLPERASKRARKIVLRAQMGIHWVWGSLLAGVVIVVVGVLFLLRDETPAPPFVELTTLDALSDLATSVDEPSSLLVATGGRVQAFTTATGARELAYCEPARTLEAPGRVWNLAGRALDGGTSLLLHPVRVVDGTIYVDPSTTLPGPPPRDDGRVPTC